ncbi:hypothetical protein C8Q75DRAFT_177971 [Abortiporus biennis]|nr:hypothetical protein C8Q75DRAFT_177971 [Abortiporus biennis]
MSDSHNNDTSRSPGWGPPSKAHGGQGGTATQTPPPNFGPDDQGGQGGTANPDFGPGDQGGQGGVTFDPTTGVAYHHGGGTGTADPAWQRNQAFPGSSGAAQGQDDNNQTSGKASMGQRVFGQAERMTGKMTGSQNLAQKGEARKTGGNFS